MTITNIPGSLYFLKETDFYSGTESNYVKIGLVKKDRSSEKRIYEHQTGNPREITLHHEIVDVPFITNLENMIHYLFNEFRISGEWFKLDAQDLENIIVEAEHWKTNQLSFYPLYEKANALLQKPSNGKIINSSPEAKKRYDQYIEIYKEIKTLEAKADVIKYKIIDAAEKSEIVKGIYTYKMSSPSNSFKKAEVEKNHPEIYKQYLTCKKDYKSSFNVKNKPSLSKFNPDLYQEKNSCKLPKDDIEERAVKPSLKLKELHKALLDIDRKLAPLRWSEEVAKTHLRLLIGMNEGIDNIATHSRVIEEKEEFDSTKFKTDHPDIYKQYIRQSKPARKLILEPGRAYPF